MAGADNIKDHEFQKGQSGNPDGRPKGAKNRATILKEILALQAKGVNFKNIPKDELPDGITYEQALNYKLVDIALAGDLGALKEIHDTMHGKITDKVQTEHSFKQMGKITMSNGEGEKKLDLSFNVGAPAEKPETAEE